MKLSNRGFAALQMILIIGIIMILLLEIYRDYAVHSGVKNVMERLVNISISMAISEDTKEGQAMIDVALAEDTFNNLLRTELGLTSNNRFGEDYQLYIDSIVINKLPPAIEVKGLIEVSPFLLSQSILKELKIRLPFRVKSKTQHIGY